MVSLTIMERRTTSSTHPMIDGLASPQSEMHRLTESRHRRHRPLLESGSSSQAAATALSTAGAFAKAPSIGAASVKALSSARATAKTPSSGRAFAKAPLSVVEKGLWSPPCAIRACERAGLGHAAWEVSIQQLVVLGAARLHMDIQWIKIEAQPRIAGLLTIRLTWRQLPRPFRALTSDREITRYRQHLHLPQARVRRASSPIFSTCQGLDLRPLRPAGERPQTRPLCRGACKATCKQI